MSTGTTELVTQNGQADGKPVTLPARQIRVVEDDGINACLLDTARFEHMQRIATVMANCALIPEHLLGKMKKGEETKWFPKEQVVGNCFLIVNQALRWGFDPFAVAAETYVVSGKLGFQGKLISALVNSRANLKHRLRYTYNDAKGDALEITVTGHFSDEDEPRTITMTVGQGRTTNDMWVKDPYQKLYYSAVTKWARRHCPEIIMGVFTDDDLDRIRDRERAIEAEPTKKLSDMIGSGVLKGDSAIQDEVDRRTVPKTRKKKEVTPEAASETKTAEPETKEPTTETKEPTTETVDPEQKPADTADIATYQMENCEKFLHSQGLKCWEADPNSMWAMYKMAGQDPIILTKTIEKPIPKGAFGLLLPTEDPLGILKGMIGKKAP